MTSTLNPEPRTLNPGFRSHLTLALCTILHAFTHAYAMLLVPLYLMVQEDLKLSGVAKVSWLVTIYGVVYFLGSYLAGMAADRFDRKLLLGLGLLGNATAVLAMGLTHDYHTLVALAVLAGVAGTIFHPAANAMVTDHYPKHPGMAIGLLGIGSGLGFWAGPQFAGWRSRAATWQFAGVSDWQRPVIEAGVAGLVIGVVFLLIATEAKKHSPSPRRGEGEGEGRDANTTNNAVSPTPRDLSALADERLSPVDAPPLTPTHSPRGEREPKAPLGRDLTIRTLLVALVLGFRDLAGVATMSLLSIYLLKAHQQTPSQVGFVLGTAMLAATMINPLLVWATPGRRRLPSLAIVLLLGGVVIATLPHWPLSAVLPVMCVFMTFQLGSYAVSDAAMLERVPSSARGRVTGLFLLYAGTLGSTGPWLMGRWTDHLGDAALQPQSYGPLFLTLGIGMWLAALCPPLIAKMGKVGVSPPIEPISETMPGTMSAVG